MNYRILVGDVLDKLATIADESVHCVVTSPPYWGLRDYGVEGQIGLESTPAEFLAKMVAVFAEVRRVLRKDGTCWVNMGDSYAAAPGQRVQKDGGRDDVAGWKQATNNGSCGVGSRDIVGLKPKNLVGMPWRLAFALQDDGWYLRQDIIWSKPNPMPESVTDRCTKAHEYLFLLTKSARYYYDADAIRTPFSDETKALSFDTMGFDRRDTYRVPIPVAGWATGEASHSAKDHAVAKSHHGSKFNSGKTGALKPTVSSAERMDNSKGANKRSVWEICTEAFPEAHFATFPKKLVEPCIRAGCPTGGTVLDPFNGSGTTGLVALANRCNYIGIELNPEYAAMTERRLKSASAQEVMDFQP